MAETARPAGRGSWFRRTLAIGQLPDWRRASEGESTELQDHRYDPERPWRYAFAWREGVLRPLLQRGDFWVIFAASIGLRVLMTSLDVDTGLEHMVDDVPQFAQLITFLLIFYNGVCYQRFLDAYRMTNECAVSTMALVAASVGALRSATSSHNLARYSLTLFHLAVYEGRGAVSWDTLTVRRLLSEEEVGALRERGGDCTSDTVLAWAFEEVRMATEDGAVPAPVAAFLYRSLEGLMHGLHALKGTIRMPVALAYFQLENLFVYVFVIAVALKQPYEAALLDSLEATGSAASGAAIRRFGLVRFMASTFVTEVTFLGIRELSIMLADPFGDDAVDLKLDRYLWAATARAAKVLDGVDLPPPPRPSDSAEPTPADAKDPPGRKPEPPPRCMRAPIDLRHGQRAPRFEDDRGADPPVPPSPLAAAAVGSRARRESGSVSALLPIAPQPAESPAPAAVRASAPREMRISEFGR